MHGKMLLSGPSGAGKTYTALTIAEVLATSSDGPGRVLLIDTEKESSLTYADLFVFDHLRWAAPFDPRHLADTLAEAGEEYDVVIVDSFTHFWRGTGGTLDIANGKFTGWKEARPVQVDVVEAVLEADAHVICCVRSKMAHAQETGTNGKQQVVKLGIEPEQDGDFEYEVNVSIEMDMQHTLQVGKSRTNAVPVGTVFHAGHAADFATIYRDWLAAGEAVVDHDKVVALIARLNEITDVAERSKAKHIFLDVFGRPEFLLESKYDEAESWVVERVEACNAEETPAEAPGEDAVTPPTATSPAPEPDAAPEPAPEAHTATQDVDDETAAREARYVEHVRAMPVAKVREQLRAAGLTTSGTPSEIRARLAAHLLGMAATAHAES
jgi:hypothetical protein